MLEPSSSISDIDAIAYAIDKLNAEHAVFFPLT